MKHKKHTNHLEQELNTFEQQLSTIQQILAKESVQHREYLTSSKHLLLKNAITYSKSSCLAVNSHKLQPMLDYFNSRLTNQIELYESKADKYEVLDTMSDFSLFASQKVIKLCKECCE